MMLMSFRWSVLLVAMIFTLSACGKSEKFPVAQVEGCVKCNGQPVTAGLVVFTPTGTSAENPEESGRSASGVIKPDGTYELTTYDPGDGAIIGSHSVQVFAPAPLDDDAPLTDANRYVCGKTALQKSVEPGDNLIDLELTKR
jgi:hypothetical protein